MIDELEESAVKLATSEREQAWREMAKQVAHEIKNPLTPMRLTVQNFQRKFDINDPDIYKKVDEYSKTLIQQIDTMSSIASAFSNFAKMPAQQNDELNGFYWSPKHMTQEYHAASSSTCLPHNLSHDPNHVAHRGYPRKVSFAFLILYEPRHV